MKYVIYILFKVRLRAIALREWVYFILAIVSIVGYFLIQDLQDLLDQSYANNQISYSLKEIQGQNKSSKNHQALFVYLDESVTVTKNPILAEVGSRLNKEVKTGDVKFPRVLLLSYFQLLADRDRLDEAKINFSVSSFYEAFRGRICQENKCLQNLKYHSDENFIGLKKGFKNTPVPNGSFTNLELPIDDFKRKFQDKGDCLYSMDKYSKINVLIISDFDDDSELSKGGDIYDKIKLIEAPHPVQFTLVRLPAGLPSDGDLRAQSKRIKSTLKEFNDGVKDNIRKNIYTKILDWSDYDFDDDLSDIVEQFAFNVSVSYHHDKEFEFFRSAEKSSSIKIFSNSDSLEVLKFNVGNVKTRHNMELKIEKCEESGETLKVFGLPIKPGLWNYNNMFRLSRGQFIRLTINNLGDESSENQIFELLVVSGNDFTSTRIKSGIIPTGRLSYRRAEFALISVFSFLIISSILVSLVRRFTPPPIHDILESLCQKDANQRIILLAKVKKFLRRERYDYSRLNQIEGFLSFYHKKTTFSGEQSLLSELIANVENKKSQYLLSQLGDGTESTQES